LPPAWVVLQVPLVDLSNGLDPHTSNIEKGDFLVMSRRLLTVFLAIIALTTMGASVWAKNDAGDTITANIKFNTATSVGTTQIPAGEYKVVADGSKAKFQQGNKVVAEVPCTLKDSTVKINQTTFVLDHDKLTEIQVSGKSKTIEFSSGM
jgi:hypothetical protein